MKKKDVAYYVYWLIFICVASGIFGAIIQICRFGGIVESGSIGPTGF